jgi:hypothetical protein
MEEQLFPGKNGYILKTDDYDQVIRTIEAVLNKKTTTNKSLAAMSVYSNKIALEQEKNSYLRAVDNK